MDKSEGRRCSKCEQTLPLSEFWKHPRGKDGLRSRCRACVTAQNQDLRRKRTAQLTSEERYERNKRVKLRDRGLTPAQFDAMKTEQGNLCAICGRPESVIEKSQGKPRELAIDHDHDTGQFRALLCSFCNLGLGWFRDNPETLRQAAIYVEHWRKINEQRQLQVPQELHLLWMWR